MIGPLRITATLLIIVGLHRMYVTDSCRLRVGLLAFDAFLTLFFDTNTAGHIRCFTLYCWAYQLIYLLLDASVKLRACAALKDSKAQRDTSYRHYTNKQRCSSDTFLFYATMFSFLSTLYSIYNALNSLNGCQFINQTYFLCFPYIIALCCACKLRDRLVLPWQQNFCFYIWKNKQIAHWPTQKFRNVPYIAHVCQQYL